MHCSTCTLPLCVEHFLKLNTYIRNFKVCHNSSYNSLRVLLMTICRVINAIFLNVNRILMLSFKRVSNLPSTMLITSLMKSSFLEFSSQKTLLAQDPLAFLSVSSYNFFLYTFPYLPRGHPTCKKLVNLLLHGQCNNDENVLTRCIFLGVLNFQISFHVDYLYSFLTCIYRTIHIEH